MKGHKRIADAIAVLYLTWIALMFLSFPFALAFEWYKPMAIVVVAITVFAWVVFLVSLVISLRQRIELHRQFMVDCEQFRKGKRTMRFLCKYASAAVAAAILVTACGLSYMLFMLFTVASAQQIPPSTPSKTTSAMFPLVNVKGVSFEGLWSLESKVVGALLRPTKSPAAVVVSITSGPSVEDLRFDVGEKGFVEISTLKEFRWQIGGGQQGTLLVSPEGKER